MKKLTKTELNLVSEVVRTMISWGEGGSLTKDDGSGDLDKRKVGVAKRALSKLEVMGVLAN